MHVCVCVCLSVKRVIKVDVMYVSTETGIKKPKSKFQCHPSP